MANIHDYLSWRGDIPFKQVPPNAVDALVFSQLSYIKWNTCGQSLRDAAALCRSRGNFARGMLAEHHTRLMELCASGDRFGEVFLADYADEYDEVMEKQFSAVTFLLPNDLMMIAFRGTDGTLTGWKEDFNMAFSEPIPSQKRAAEYLSLMAKTYPERGILLCGHSKGGNLALYACACTDETLKSRLLAVNCFDSPGLSNAVCGNIAPIENRIFTFIPQSSIIGMLFTRPENQTVVESTSVSILQHSAYTWQVMGGSFVASPKLNRSSMQVEKIVRDYLAVTDEEQRRAFINTLFDVLAAADSQHLGKETILGLLKNPTALVSSFKGLDGHTRQKLIESLLLLGGTVLTNGINRKEDTDHGKLPGNS